MKICQRVSATKKKKKTEQEQSGLDWSGVE